MQIFFRLHRNYFLQFFFRIKLLEDPSEWQEVKYAYLNLFEMLCCKFPKEIINE